MKPTLVYLTAGGAGMFCGSCMHDNTLARALARQGVDLLLTPLYTPIRTDEENASIDRVFFGGINVYLQQKIPLLRRAPEFIDRIFDQPWLLRLATSFGIETDAKQLGAMTVSMLRGARGFQRKEVLKLCRWLADEVRPDLIISSNVLIAGSAPEIKRHLERPLVVTLQGDDLFLNDLLEPYRSQALEEIRRLDGSIDGYLAHSRYYADYMAELLGIDREKIRLAPLGIDTHDFSEPSWDDDGDSQHNAGPRAARPRVIGYLARLAPEKGLHVLVDAFLELHRRPGMDDVRLHIAGWLGDGQRAYAEEQFNKMRQAGLGDRFHYAGVVDRRQKVAFLQELDVFSAPTVYREPKGLFVLEALAAGVPVVQPAHGAFPELLAETGGGVLTRPGDPVHLADALEELLVNPDRRRQLARDGQRNVHARFNADAMARATRECLAPFLSSERAGALLNAKGPRGDQGP